MSLDPEEERHVLRPWRCDLVSCPRKGRHEQRPSGCFFSCVAPQGGVSVSPAPRRRGSHTQSVAPWPPSWTVAHSFWVKHSTHSPLL